MKSHNEREETVAEPHTEIVRASEIEEKVVRRILEIREPDVFKEYRKELATYKRRLGKKTESEITQKSLLGTTHLGVGFVAEAYGQKVAVLRPKEPKPRAYSYMGYDRSYGFTTHAAVNGLLSDPAYNREIRPARVDEYSEAMRAGLWRDLLSDPIAITSDGQVVNGQHRIAAVCSLDWSDDPTYDPSFLVVWNVDPAEAMHADGSRRTARDEKTIASKLLATAST